MQYYIRSSPSSLFLYTVSSRSEPHLNKSRSQIVASIPTAHLQWNRSRSQIVDSVSFEATYVSARGSHIDTVSTVAARYVAACIVLFKDFIVAEFEFVQVKRTNFDDKLSFKWGVSRPNKRRSQTVASLELYSLLCQKMKNLVAAASAREDTVLHTTCT